MKWGDAIPERIMSILDNAFQTDVYTIYYSVKDVSCRVMANLRSYIVFCSGFKALSITASGYILKGKRKFIAYSF